MEYVEGIVKPYLIQAWKDVLFEFNNDEALLKQSYPKGIEALMIWDQHWSHLCSKAVYALSSLDIIPKETAAKGTNLFSVLNVALNRSYKHFFRNHYNE